MTLPRRGWAVVSTDPSGRPLVPSRWPLHEAPSEPTRVDVRRVPHPLLGGKPSRLPLASGHHPCAPCLSYPNVVRSSPRVVEVWCAPPARKKTMPHPFLFPTAEWALGPGTFAAHLR